MARSTSSITWVTRSLHVNSSTATCPSTRPAQPTRYDLDRLLISPPIWSADESNTPRAGNWRTRGLVGDDVGRPRQEPRRDRTSELAVESRTRTMASTPPATSTALVMYNVTRLVHLASGVDEARVEVFIDELRKLWPALTATWSNPTLPGSRNGVTSCCTASSATDRPGRRNRVGCVAGPGTGRTSTASTTRTRDACAAVGGWVYRTPLVAVAPETPPNIVAEFEADLLLMPSLRRHDYGLRSAVHFEPWARPPGLTSSSRSSPTSKA